MSLLDDILKALDRWKEWKDMRAAPARITELEARVESVESELGDTSGGHLCEHCGSRRIRPTGTRPTTKRPLALAGVLEIRYKCKDCEK